MDMVSDNVLFPKWITATAVLNQIIDSQCKVSASESERPGEVTVKLFQFDLSSIVPEEDHEQLERSLHTVQKVIAPSMHHVLEQFQNQVLDAATLLQIEYSLELEFNELAMRLFNFRTYQEVCKAFLGIQPYFRHINVELRKLLYTT